MVTSEWEDLLSGLEARSSIFSFMFLSCAFVLNHDTSATLARFERSSLRNSKLMGLLLVS